jgi:hypothetical protein
VRFAFPSVKEFFASRVILLWFYPVTSPSVWIDKLTANQLNPPTILPRLTFRYFSLQLIDRLDHVYLRLDITRSQIMTPAHLMARLPPLFVLSGFLNFATGHVLPQPTKTVDFHEINALSYPFAATAAPDDSFLQRRQFNTVCGYIGGDPGLPATCSAGSHCVVDADHGAVGCCPNAGSCTQGVFTNCVDADSGPQTEVNPYVFTCKGSNSCYKNSFDGGFFQYGCGSTSGLATKVVPTASG